MNPLSKLGIGGIFAFACFQIFHNVQCFKLVRSDL